MVELLADNEKFGNVGGVALSRVPYSTDRRTEKLRRDELAIMTFGERMKEEMLTREQGKIFYYVPLLQRMFAHVHRFEGSTSPLADIHGRIKRSRTGMGLGWDGSTVQRTEEDAAFLVYYLTRSLESCVEKRELSRKLSGGWRHRVGEEYCERRHRGSKSYMEKWFERDERVETGTREWRGKVCQSMRKLHRKYCENWDCCEAYRQTRNTSS